MKESVLRRNHRYLGITLALFLLLQGGSGLLISINELFAPEVSAGGEAIHDAAQGRWLNGAGDHAGNDPEGHEHGLLGLIHHHGGTLGNLYRVVVGSGLMAMLLSGTAIFMKTRSRLKKAQG